MAFNFSFDPSKTLATSTGLAGATGVPADPAYIAFSIINTSLIFLGTITVIMILIAGFIWLLAGGAEEKISKAKDLLKGAVVGLAIVLSSYGLAQFVFLALRQAILKS